jgi:hypothetical protein
MQQGQGDQKVEPKAEEASASDMVMSQSHSLLFHQHNPNQLQVTHPASQSSPTSQRFILSAS